MFRLFLGSAFAFAIAFIVTFVFSTGILMAAPFWAPLVLGIVTGWSAGAIFFATWEV
jgi:hypothetical protein